MRWRPEKWYIGTGPNMGGEPLVGGRYASWRFIKCHPDWMVARLTTKVRGFFATLRTVRVSLRRPPDHWRNDPR